MWPRVIWSIRLGWLWFTWSMQIQVWHWHWAWAHSISGTWHTVATLGFADLWEFLRKIATLAKAYCLLLKEPLVVGGPRRQSIHCWKLLRISIYLLWLCSFIVWSMFVFTHCSVFMLAALKSTSDNSNTCVISVLASIEYLFHLVWDPLYLGMMSDFRWKHKHYYLMRPLVLVCFLWQCSSVGKEGAVSWFPSWGKVLVPHSVSLDTQGNLLIVLGRGVRGFNSPFSLHRYVSGWKG